MRLLIAEDDPCLRDELVRGLLDLAYAVDATGNGAEALVMAVVHDFDALVLDILLPEKDGLTICRGLRARGVMVPILLLTSRDAVDDRIGGLDAGADDYLTKPFAFGELSARLRALLRRPTPLSADRLSVAILTRLCRFDYSRGAGTSAPWGAESMSSGSVKDSDPLMNHPISNATAPVCETCGGMLLPSVIFPCR